MILRTCVQVAFLLSLAGTLHAANSTQEAKVLLKSITIFSQKSWLWYPQVYFRCSDGNETNLSFAKQVLHFYQLQGNETWQPLLRLQPHECKKCGVYERVWFTNGMMGEWKLCTSNFSTISSDDMLTLIEKKSVTLNLACPQCPVEDAEKDQAEEAPPPAGPSEALKIILGVFAGAGGLLLTVTVVTLIIYMRRDSSPMVYEERSKMLEMDRVDSAMGMSQSSSFDRAESSELPHVAEERRHVSDVLRDGRDDDDFL